MASPSTPPGVRASVRVYRWLLRAFPADYRREWAPSMEQLFRDCAMDECSRSGPVGLAVLWLRTARDLAFSLLREYRRPRVRRMAGAIRAPLPLAHPMTNFTPRAQQALAMARKQTDRFGHDQVGPGHLLLGILRLDSNAALGILAQLNVDPSALGEAVERSLGGPPGQPRSGGPFFAPSLKRALALAIKEARDLGHSYVGCEHLLAGLARLDGEPTQAVLKEFGVDAGRWRTETVAFLKKRPPSSLTPTSYADFLENAVPLQTDSATPQPPFRIFEGEGRCILQSAAVNEYGHLRLRLLVFKRLKPAPKPPVTFDVTDQNLPNEQWAVIQGAIRRWAAENPRPFSRCLVAVNVYDGSWQAGAAPAFDRAAVFALHEAVKKAEEAGALPTA